MELSGHMCLPARNHSMWEILLKEFPHVNVIPVRDSHPRDFDRAMLNIHQILPNFYASSKPSVERNPLIVIVPDRHIECVWPASPSEYLDIRYGTAGKQSNRIVTAMYLFKKSIDPNLENIGLYICLDPIDSKIKLEVGEMGI